MRRCSVSDTLPLVSTYGDAIGALADPTRRAVLEELRHGGAPVGELAARLPVTRPAVSQHLKVLKSAGLVTERRAGTRRIYSVNRDGLAEVRAYLDAFWDDALQAFETAAETEKEREHGD